MAKRDQEIPGLLPAMNAAADQLPEPFRTVAKLAIAIFGFTIIIMLIIFLLGVFVATLTGHPEQDYTIFPQYIYGIAFVAVVVIVVIARKTILQK